MRWLLTLVIALVGGFAGAALWQFAGVGPNPTREYLLANPEVLPEAIEVLNRRETLAKVEPLRDELEAPFPGAMLGNPDGKVTLVEFSDYACGYCRQSMDDVMALIAANPDLKVVIREFPILSEGSGAAARMALAAAQQGKYAAFHDAMFAKDGPSEENIAAAAREAGVDIAKAQAAIDGGAFEGQLQNNMFLAQSLGFSGTPSWIVGDQVLNGAVGIDKISQAIEAARKS
ncbi:DsbA family protein [Aurantiacibacter xanthus]|uniref:DsbA family protein n=1 Tax=Aurantiacibacter xanthus TaxID=1784712 RepID=A0A3A1P518_9SPHN|nr:DsbA family protein [Aurantiacibacter xanthus]RIV85405.1 DsbA family protein [Aurantiacibacter xanthus]